MTAKPVYPPMAIFFPPLARFAAYSMFLSLAIFWSMTALFIWFWWPRLSSMELAALSGWAVILAGTSVWWMDYYFSRLVFWAELDDHFRCRTWSSEHTVPWNEVGRLILREDTNPLPGLKILSVMLTDGKRLSIWTRSAQADAALEIVRTKPWASDWPGAPLGFGVALVVMSLGLIALSMGLIAGYWLLHGAFRTRPTTVPDGPHKPDHCRCRGAAARHWRDRIRHLPGDLSPRLLPPRSDAVH